MQDADHIENTEQANQTRPDSACAAEQRRFEIDRDGVFRPRERADLAPEFLVNMCALPSGTVKLKRRIKMPTRNSRNPLSCPKATKSTRKKEKLRPGWGLPSKPATYRTKSYNTVYEAVTTMEQSFDKHELLYVVATLPGDTEQSKEAFEDYCAYFSSRMIRYVRKVIHNPLYIKVWEYQQRSALHFNLFIRVPPKARPAFTTEAIKDECGRIFRTIGSFRDIDMFETCDGFTWAHDDSKWRIEAAPLRSSLADYLAKKHSKQPRTRVDGSSVSPGRWFDISAALRALVKRETVEATVRVDSEVEQLLLQEALVEAMSKGGTVREICNPITGQAMGVSFKAADINQVRDAIRGLSSENQHARLTA